LTKLVFPKKREKTFNHSQRAGKEKK